MGIAYGPAPYSKENLMYTLYTFCALMLIAAVVYIVRLKREESFMLTAYAQLNDDHEALEHDMLTAYAQLNDDYEALEQGMTELGESYEADLADASDRATELLTKLADKDQTIGSKIYQNLDLIAANERLTKEIAQMRKLVDECETTCLPKL